MDPVKWVEVTLKVRILAGETDASDEEMLMRDATFTALHDGAEFVSKREYTQDMDTGEEILNDNIIWVYVNDESDPSLVYDKSMMVDGYGDIWPALDMAIAIAQDVMKVNEEIWNVRADDEMGNTMIELSSLIRSECGL
jgi:hypothetical protein